MVYFARILTIAVAFSFLSAPASAENASFGAQVQRWLDTKVSIWRCGQETEAVRAEFRAVIVRGLANLRVINRNLVETRFRENANNSLKVICGKPFTLFPTDVYAYYFNGIFGRKIYLGDGENRAWLKTEALNGGVVFHEFLHFLNFDSVAKEQHNGGVRPGDAVYMCALAAFPELAVISGQSYYDYSKQDPNFARKLCAAARIENDKVVIPKKELVRVIKPLLPPSLRARLNGQ